MKTTAGEECARTLEFTQQFGCHRFHNKSYRKILKDSKMTLR